MYTENKSIDWLTAITPTTDDLVVTMDQTEVWVAKSSTLASIYNLFKTTYDTLYAKYLGDADFYKYSITTSESGGNLTVALKNFEGNDPTATKPVKIQIGGVIRTITSALSYTRNAWNNILNMWSSELATKEVDLFAYLFYYPTTWAVVIAYARIPNANTISDLSYDALTEKWFDYPYDWNLPPSSTSIANIGRFNATLSAGGAYTWSIPATSVIINSPAYETRWLDWQPSVTASGSMTIASLSFAEAKYKISGDSLSINYSATYTTGWTASSDVISTVPFTFLSSSILWFSSPCYDSADFQASGILDWNGIIIRKNWATWTLWTGRLFGIHTFWRI